MWFEFPIPILGQIYDRDTIEKTKPEPEWLGIGGK